VEADIALRITGSVLFLVNRMPYWLQQSEDMTSQTNASSLLLKLPVVNDQVLLKKKKKILVCCDLVFLDIINVSYWK